MENVLAKRMGQLKPSGTMAMAEMARRLAKKGWKVLHLEVGDPDFDTPNHIKEAALKALKEGFTHYTSSRGIPELREAIAEDLKKRHKIEIDPENEVIVTPGSKHAIYSACMAILNPRDEVIVLSPTWPTHFTCIEAVEAIPVEVPCGETYRLDEEKLKEKITQKTKMILISSPNNPTGGVLSREDVKAVTDIAEDYNLLVLSDEIYDCITYDGVNAESAASVADSHERVILVNGFSKRYAMTGWRLGYAVADKVIIEALSRIQQTTTTCPASFIQKAGVAALTGSQECVEKMIKEYDRRRIFLIKELNSIPGLKCPTPKGAFYVFLKYSDKNPSMEICKKLLEEKGVCTTPGGVFGQYGEGQIRISYATSLETLKEAVERIMEFFSETSN
ncbi:TPA: pyridoxal phosphate-dependent aminotransferase [Candidatus Bathyarchaeota archaeon]|nr:pyridoxal phosphate-dependent aminotransferase [Candidatus Bathyarchaeota archaeon]